MIWIDIDNSTLLIGAVPKDSFLVESRGYAVDLFWEQKILISTITGRGDTLNFTGIHLLPLASTMAWIENTLNFTNGYYKVTGNEGDQFEYLVPFPPGYTSTMKAHWTTDVIVLDPSCSWQTATTVMEPGIWSWDVMLPESNLSITLDNSSFGMFLLSSKFFMCLLDFSIKRVHFECADFSLLGPER